MKRGFDVLQLIQDVDWVVGSFIANRRGELLLYQMPPEFGEAELARTSARLLSIVRSAELCGVAVEQCEFSFSRYQLLVNRCAAGLLCVVVEAPVSRPALSMATRLVLSELPELVRALDSSAEGDGPPAAHARSAPLDRFGAVGPGAPARG